VRATWIARTTAPSGIWKENNVLRTGFNPDAVGWIDRMPALPQEFTQALTAPGFSNNLSHLQDELHLCRWS
jgi:hypothetical protein